MHLPSPPTLTCPSPLRQSQNGSVNASALDFHADCDAMLEYRMISIL